MKQKSINSEVYHIISVIILFEKLQDHPCRSYIMWLQQLLGPSSGGSVAAFKLLDSLIFKGVSNNGVAARLRKFYKQNVKH